MNLVFDSAGVVPHHKRRLTPLRLLIERVIFMNRVEFLQQRIIRRPRKAEKIDNFVNNNNKTIFVISTYYTEWWIHIGR